MYLVGRSRVLRMTSHYIALCEIANSLSRTLRMRQSAEGGRSIFWRHCLLLHRKLFVIAALPNRRQADAQRADGRRGRAPDEMAIGRRFVQPSSPTPAPSFAPWPARWLRSRSFKYGIKFWNLEVSRSRSGGKGQAREGGHVETRGC